MKSLSWAVLGLLMAVPSFAADNNIKMVTYFPVPYAAYGDLGVTGTCDVGLMGQCKLDAGKNLTVAKGASDSRALNTGSIIVRKGTLGLTPASSVAAGTSITAGSAIGTGILEFSHDLAVTSINSSRLAKARAMNEAQMNSLNMYGNVFPKCDESGNKISWKKLTMGKKSGVFLVCGGNNTCSGKGTESCGCENKGTRSRVCDTSTGRWSAWSECSIEDCSCDDRTYKLAHKSECCPKTSSSDTDCYAWAVEAYPGSYSDEHKDPQKGCYYSTGSCSLSDARKCTKEGQIVSRYVEVRGNGQSQGWCAGTTMECTCTWDKYGW